MLPRFGSYHLGRLPADEIENWLNDEVAAGRIDLLRSKVRVTEQLIRLEIRGLMTSRLDVESARTISVPVLLVIGEHSVDLAQPHAAAVAELLPNAREVVLEDREHVADVLDPEHFAAQILPS